MKRSRAKGVAILKVASGHMDGMLKNLQKAKDKPDHGFCCGSLDVQTGYNFQPPVPSFPQHGAHFTGAAELDATTASDGQHMQSYGRVVASNCADRFQA